MIIGATRVTGHHLSVLASGVLAAAKSTTAPVSFAFGSSFAGHERPKLLLIRIILVSQV
jgi:hypothetical protein